MSPQGPEATPSRMLLWAIIALVLARLISLAFYPLMDTTEARYADIARRMVERADWVTPWFTDSEPFWGKPPLSFWVTALGFKLFGINEFGGRLPHFVLGALVGALTWLYARHRSARAAWHAVALLSTSLLFIVISGAVTTDMALALGTTLVMVGFWAAMREHAARLWTWRLLVALGLTVGLLAKGPLAMVLCGAPIGVWLIWQRRLLDSWRRMAWLRTGLLVLLFSLPWYVLAERRTPGFLNYFLIGEHWHRFMTPLWTGDRYGVAHAFPRGGIWLFALGACWPWPLLLAPLAWLRSRQKASTAISRTPNPERLYLLLWALWPCVFFTLAGNILWTYVLPGLPALAILMAHWTSGQSGKSTEWLLTAGVWLCTVTLVIAVVLANGIDYRDRRSAKSLMSDYRAVVQAGEPLFYLVEVPFSASFYSDGQAQGPIDLAQLATQTSGASALVAMTSGQQATLPEVIKDRFSEVARRGSMVLMRWH